jgi:mannitol/fructose-specific phosphotransferase system IIA component (Ntr-type)
MTELFRKEALGIEHGSKSWQEALEITGKLLFDLGSIEEGYIQAMIDAVHKFGPYVVIAPGIALGHAAAGKYVLQNDMVLLVFEEPIIFHSENDPVHIIIGLCALEPNMHIDHLNRVSELLDDDDIVEKFLEISDCDELFKFVNGKSN